MITMLDRVMELASMNAPHHVERVLHDEILRLRAQWSDRLEGAQICYRIKLRDQLELARLERDEARDLQEAHAAVCKQWIEKFAIDLGHALGHLANAAETVGVRVELK